MNTRCWNLSKRKNENDFVSADYKKMPVFDFDSSDLCGGAFDIAWK
jgi:hypothetical protein